MTMGVKTRSRDPSDREKWDKIFKGLVKMLRTKQDQLESLVKDRKILQDRINSQHDRWVSDVRLYGDQLSSMKSEIETMEMMRLVEIAKWDMLIGLKNRDASLCKLKLEHTENELDDFRAWFDLLSANLNACESENCDSKAADNKSLETEIRRLKLEYEKLASEKNCEVSTLLRENGFAWNQFKRLESELSDTLKVKEDEVVQANMKISSLISHQERLQSSSQEKDAIILRLKAKVAELEEDSSKKDEEISRLSKELESSRKLRQPKHTPFLARCTTQKNGSSGNTGETNLAVKKELSGPIFLAPSTQGQQGSKSLKRKRQKETPLSETPKLFTSTFKVPKLKVSSPQVIQLS